MPVYDLDQILSTAGAAGRGQRAAAESRERRELLRTETARSKLQLQEEQEAIERDKQRRRGLSARAGWVAKWAGRDRTDEFSADAVERLSSFARRGPLAFGAALASETMRAASRQIEAKRLEAERVARMLAPEDQQAFLEDRRAELQEEAIEAGKAATRNSLANLARRAGAVGFDEVAQDAEALANHVMAGAVSVGQAHQQIATWMDAIANERKRQYTELRVTETLQGMIKESAEPDFYESLLGDMEAGVITAEQANQEAKRKFYGIDSNVLRVPGIKEPIQSQTDLMSGRSRPFSVMPDSARAEAQVFAEHLAAQRPGFDMLSPEQQDERIVDTMINLMRIGGWEISEEDEAELRGLASPEGGGAGGGFEALPEFAQETLANQMREAVQKGASAEDLRELWEGAGLVPEDMPPELQDELAEIAKKRRAAPKPRALGRRALEAEQRFSAERGAAPSNNALIPQPPIPGQEAQVDPKALQGFVEFLKGPKKKPSAQERPLSPANSQMMLENGAPVDTEALKAFVEFLKGRGKRD